MHWALCFATLLNPTAGVSSPASRLCRSSCVYASSFATCQKNTTWWHGGGRANIVTMSELTGKKDEADFSLELAETYMKIACDMRHHATSKP